MSKESKGAHHSSAGLVLEAFVVDNDDAAKGVHHGLYTGVVVSKDLFI
jgi:hypothetical protein